MSSNVAFRAICPRPGCGERTPTLLAVLKHEEEHLGPAVPVPVPPVIERLARRLYEVENPQAFRPSWSTASEEDRRAYRNTIVDDLLLKGGAR